MPSREQEIRQALFSALSKALSWSAPEASRRLFRAYSDPPPVMPPPSFDVCYYALFPDASAPPRPEELSVSSSRLSLYSFQPHVLQLVFYGPSSAENALLVRSRLFLDGSGQPRRLLRSAGLYPVPRPPLPTVLPESEDSARRLRADLTVSVWIASSLESGTVGTVSRVPDLIWPSP